MGNLAALVFIFNNGKKHVGGHTIYFQFEKAFENENENEKGEITRTILYVWIENIVFVVENILPDIVE